MKRVILESPYGSKDEEIVKRNVAYAREALRDCLLRGESPLASHLLYTQVLDDNNPEERKAGIEAGHAWINSASAVVFYLDYGASPGMERALKQAYRYRIPIERRFLYTTQVNESQQEDLVIVSNYSRGPDSGGGYVGTTGVGNGIGSGNDVGPPKHMPKLKSPFPEH